MVCVMDWVAWHRDYEDPTSSLSARLRRVRYHLSGAIGQAPAGPVSVVSLCAGQGRDVIGVLPGHPRRDDVRAVLIEADATNAAVARRATVHVPQQVAHDASWKTSPRVYRSPDRITDTPCRTGAADQPRAERTGRSRVVNT